MSEFVERQESSRARRLTWLGLAGVVGIFVYAEVSTWSAKQTHFAEFKAYCAEARPPDQCAERLLQRGERCYQANHPAHEFTKHRLPDERRWRGRQRFYRCVLLEQRSPP